MTFTFYSYTGYGKQFPYRVIHVLKKSKVFACDVCDKVFSYKKDFRYHNLLFHPKHHLKSKYRCELCNKGFSELYRLESHVISHLKDYICEKCDKQFTQKGHLKKHMKAVHLKSKEYICGKCYKQFTQKWHLKVHMKTVHLNIKEYTCKECNKQFKHRCHLKVHMMTVHVTGPST